MAVLLPVLVLALALLLLLLLMVVVLLLVLVLLLLLPLLFLRPAHRPATTQHCLAAAGRCREHAPRSGGHYYAGTPLGVWRTADEPMVLIAYQPKDFATLCQVRMSCIATYSTFHYTLHEGVSSQLFSALCYQKKRFECGSECGTRCWGERTGWITRISGAARVVRVAPTHDGSLRLLALALWHHRKDLNVKT